MGSRAYIRRIACRVELTGIDGRPPENTIGGCWLESGEVEGLGVWGGCIVPFARFGRDGLVVNAERRQRAVMG
jgi:hypothetical protein